MEWKTVLSLFLLFSRAWMIFLSDLSLLTKELMSVSCLFRGFFLFFSSSLFFSAYWFSR